jgi:hypothetical protein
VGTGHSVAGTAVGRAGQPPLRSGGETILEDAPVTYLMSLEHQLTEVLGFMRALQLTDPAEDRVWDSTEACWRTRAAPGGSPGWIDARLMLGRGRAEHLAPAER